ncbi:EAL domain-containing protein [Acetobacteraceae bacterium H6797]|nr:EAL domain-containing protein [Acetobacteraceae bacterium H6797]
MTPLRQGIKGLALSARPSAGASVNAAAGMERDRFVAFAFAGGDMLVETGDDGCISFAAGAFRAHYGAPAESFLGQPLARLVQPEARGRLAQALAVLHTRGRLLPISLPLAGSGGELLLSGLAMPANEGKRFYLSFGPLPPEAVQARSVSGAEAFMRTAETRLRAAREEGNAPPVLNLVELKGDPSQVKPELNRALGDALLREAGNAITGEITAGRYGLLHHAGSSPDLAAIVRRVEETLARGGMGASLAAQEMPLSSTGLTGSQAVRALRHALTFYSREGTGGLVPAGLAGGLDGFMDKLSNRTESFRQAVAERRFGLAFQPICYMRDRKVHHYEALIRPEGINGAKPESPQDFVLFAETMGLTEELDLAVAHQTIEALQHSAEGVRIACNVSGLSLESESFRRQLLRMIETTPAARRLLVEVTETAEIENEEEAVSTAVALRALGVPICLDDFGAGAAAFRYLRTLPTDFVKIDGLYIRNAVANERDRNMLAAMVDLARAVGAKTIAEHVEAEVDVSILRALGIDMGQGWFFGRPSPLPSSMVITRRNRRV